MTTPAALLSQSTYQVRLEWGVSGVARLAPAPVVVVVDVFGLAAAAIDAVERGEAIVPEEGGVAAVLVRSAAEAGALVLVAGLRNAAAVADRVVHEQHRRGERTAVSILCGGEGYGGGPARVAVEDQLAAGAVVDALTARGIDHCSPEAAVAGEAFRALRGAARHLVSAAGGGRVAQVRRGAEWVRAQARIDDSAAVPCWCDGRLEGVPVR